MGITKCVNTRININATGMAPAFLIIIFAVFCMTYTCLFECLRTISELVKVYQFTGKGGLQFLGLLSLKHALSDFLRLAVCSSVSRALTALKALF